ncbi:MAG TPA: NapC/NirT family cytochrome c [Longimicrobiales bacterium]|nr:NapC/NirT family cytochrome c [Longimicrobiales bacterium]
MVLAIVGVAIFLAVGGGGFFAYRTYDYVQHDNEFCLSCHLMVDPFERFQASAHRDLGCKACHQPTPFQRAKMGMTAVVEDPEVIEAHAEVPNERCEHCHVDGSKEDWINISQSRGHRLHLESADGRLRGLECVTCHAEGIHEFGATNRSCTQTGCHDNQIVALGAMADMNLPCVVCHGFEEPPTGFSTAPHMPDSLAMKPDADECLSCHAMRDRISIDEATEPHGAHCSTCHNAHDQRRAADAEAKCSQGLCHGTPRDVDDNHHKWRTVDLLACLQCHRPHDFEVQGDRCGSCHADILDPEKSIAPPGGRTGGDEELLPLAWQPERIPRPNVGWASDRVHGPSAPDDAPRAWYFPGLDPGGLLHQEKAEQATFTHERHRPVPCASCHTTQNAVQPNNPEWCAGCHHTSRSGRSCTACHGQVELEGFPATLHMELPGGPEQREVPFPHQAHAQVGACAECHGASPTREAAREACVACHERHHTSETVDCRGCHNEPPTWAHEAAVVHGGCAGNICHKQFPVEDPALLARSVCEACHQEFVGVDVLPPLPPGAARDTVPLPDTLSGPRG